VSTSNATTGKGTQVAELLRLTIIGTEGHDLKVACVVCDSSDAGRVHQDTGIYHCYSCGKNLNAFDLCKIVVGHDQAKRLMYEVGLFPELFEPGGNGKPSSDGNSKPLSPDELIESMAKAKGTTVAGFRAYGAYVEGHHVHFPAYHLDSGKAERKTSFYLDARQPKGKGWWVKDGGSGVFLSGGCAPQTGETWLLLEGVKNGAMAHDLGYKALGMNGHHIPRDQQEGVLRAFVGVNVLMMPDGDRESTASLTALGRDMLKAGAASVKLVTLPYKEIKAKGGDSPRDVLKEKGADAIHQAIVAATPIELANGNKPKARPIQAPGTVLFCGDRGNYGYVVQDTGGDSITMRFEPDGQPPVVKDISVSQLRRQDGGPLDGNDTEPRQFNVYSMADLDAMDLTVDMVIDRVLMFGAPAVDGGTFKVLKTSLALEQGLSMGIGPSTQWLDHFAVVRKAVSVYFAGEGGLVPLRDTLRRQAEHKGVALREVDGFFLCDEVPRLDSDVDMQAATAILRERKAEFAYFDPCYLMMGAQAANASNVYAMGTMLGRMLRACREAGATPIVLHHFNRAKGTAQNDAPDLADLSQAGCAEIAGQWGLLGRAKPFDPERPGEHDLILSIGSRMGYCSKWALHVSEGTPDDGGRYWQPTITPFSEARKEQQGQREQEREAKQQAKLEASRKRICDVAAKFPGGESMSIIKVRTGLRPEAFSPAWASLLDDGILVPVELKKSNHKTPYEGFRLRDSDAP
jgi:hypothetical protein